MIAKYAENSYIDIDSVSYIAGDYSSNNEHTWITNVVVNGVPFTIEGPIGKNVMTAYEWKWRNSIIDMIPSSKTYKKNLKN